jgi:hypothetical protein
MGDGASEETFARVAQVISFDGPSMTSEFAEFDDHDVPAGFVDKLKTKLDAGQLSFTIHYDPADATHIALEDEYLEMDAPTNWRFTVNTPAHARRTKAFAAFVASLGPISAASDGKLERSVTLELTGQPNLAAGS